MAAVMTRREVLAALAGVSALTRPVPSAAQDFSAVRGCLIRSTQLETALGSAAGFSGLSENLITSTGDPARDRALGRALVRLAGLFGERPGFGFIDDRQGPNAFATPRTQVAGTWGTIMFGRTLFQDLMQRYDDQGIAVLAVAAHEFGHVAQFRSGIDRHLLLGQPTVRRLELHADFLSGYALGTRKRQDPSITVWAAGDTLFRIGDYQFNNRNHHGTPDQRVATAEAGFSLGSDSDTTFADAFSQGAEYVLARY